MRPSLVVAVAALVAVLSSRTEGQQLQSALRLDPDSRVRVWASSPAMTQQDAIVVRVNADTLHLLIGEREERVAFGALSRLEVRTRARGGHRWAGFLGGALLGGVVGYVAFRPSAALCEFKCNMRPANAVFVGLLGGVTGMVVGSFVPPAKWERVR